jgi:hypothetical protein
VPEGSITFRRHFLSRAETSDWATSDRPLRRIVVEPKANLEDSPCPYLVDFANAYVGGGTLTGVHTTHTPHTTHTAHTAHTTHTHTQLVLAHHTALCSLCSQCGFVQACMQEEILFATRPECLVSLYARPARSPSNSSWRA